MSTSDASTQSLEVPASRDVAAAGSNQSGKASDVPLGSHKLRNPLNNSKAENSSTSSQATPQTDRCLGAVSTLRPTASNETQSKRDSAKKPSLTVEKSKLARLEDASTHNGNMSTASLASSANQHFSPAKSSKSQDQSTANHSTKDVMSLKEWITNVNRGTNTGWNEPIVQSPTASHASRKFTTADSLEAKVQKDSDGPGLLFHGTIILHVRPAKYAQRLCAMSEEQLVEGLYKALATSRKGSRLGYEPSFSHAHMKSNQLRLELSTASREDFEKLQMKPNWANDFCLSLGPPPVPSYIVGSIGLLPTSLPAPRWALTDALLKSDDGLHDLANASRKKRILPSGEETFFQLRFVTRENANEVLSNGVKWDGTRYTCRILNAPCFKPCSNCGRLGHTSASCIYDKACLTCGGNHGQTPVNQRDCKPNCINCGGEHSAENLNCKVIVDFRKSNRFPTMAEVAIAAKHAKSSGLKEHETLKLSDNFNFTFTHEDLERLGRL